MSFNLLETAKNYFSSEFTNQASTALGESSSGISQAFSAIIPAGFVGILSKATSGTDGANSIFSMAKEAAGSLISSPDFSGLQRQESKGGNILSQLFGSNQSGIIGAISKFAGIKDSSARSLLKMSIPAIMGLLGKHAEQNNLTASGLSGFLSSQKDHILNAMPAELSSLTGMSGLGSPGAAASSLSSNVKSTVSGKTNEIVGKPGGGSKWLLPFIIILAAISLLWYFSKSCNKSTETITTYDTSTVIKTDTSGPVVTTTTTVETIKVKLPNGKELDANKGGIEDQLVTFLNSDWKSMSDSALRVKWFDFDNLNFNTGKATLLPESEKQLDNLAEILMAFPDAKIKIGGYTDSLGNAASNKKLSQDRADAAKAGLAKRGVGKQVTSAEGYGSQFAKAAPTAPDSERALDRHVSVSVRKK